jgi:hypothetical protein
MRKDTFIVAVLTTIVIACGGFLAPSSDLFAKPAQSRRLGLGVNDAGQPTTDSGQVAYLPAAPIVPPFGDPQVTQFIVTQVQIDPPTGNITATVFDGTRQRIVTAGQLTAPQLGAIMSVTKAGIATQLNVTLQ